MLKLICVVLCFWQVRCYKNPNHYAFWDLFRIKEQLDIKIRDSYYDLIILQQHIQVNADYVENSINAEIVKQLAIYENSKCQPELKEFQQDFYGDCHMEVDFQLLTQTCSKFLILKDVACSTIDICTKLNPFLNNNLEKCELQKIADLRQQIILITEEFGNLKKKLFEDHDKCIQDLMSSAYVKIANIVYNSCKKKIIFS